MNDGPGVERRLAAILAADVVGYSRLLPGAGARLGCGSGLCRDHPDEANEIMAHNVSGWLEDLTVFAETLKGIRLYDSARNREYFGTPDRPGQIYQTSQYAIDFWRRPRRAQGGHYAG